MTSFLLYLLKAAATPATGSEDSSPQSTVIAFTRPGIVYSFASMFTGRPSSRRVDDVTGPIDAKRMPSIRFAFRGRGRPRHVFFPSRATKFLTVDELVNVMTCGLCFASFRMARSFVRDDRVPKNIVLVMPRVIRGEIDQVPVDQR